MMNMNDLGEDVSPALQTLTDCYNFDVAFEKASEIEMQHELSESIWVKLWERFQNSLRIKNE